MTCSDVAHQRLANQGISRPISGSPADVVAWLGAVQAQDYYGAKWALGLRLRGATDEVVDRAFNEGAILRTHLLRPTWHFVTPDDIRWLLTLTAQRVHIANAPLYRRLEMDDTLFRHTNTVLTKALQGGGQLTRDELQGVLRGHGIAVDDGQRMAYIMMHAELGGVVCSGARRGKQFTYTLLDERVPQVKALNHEEALAELTRRYFTSRGPATVYDYAKWSGLTVAQARRGLEAVGDELEHETTNDRDVWSPRLPRPADDAAPRAHLLSIYDEYISGYRDRDDIIEAHHAEVLRETGAALQYTIVIDGKLRGTWRRTIQRGAVNVEIRPFTPLTQPDRDAIADAARRYGEFLDLPVSIT